MRTTLNLDEKLVKEVMKVTGVKEKTKLLHMGLEELLKKHSREFLSSLFGKDKKAKAPLRKRVLL